jgi:hypothetical protein
MFNDVEFVMNWSEKVAQMALAHISPSSASDADSDVLCEPDNLTRGSSLSSLPPAARHGCGLLLLLLLLLLRVRVRVRSGGVDCGGTNASVASAVAPLSLLPVDSLEEAEEADWLRLLWRLEGASTRAEDAATKAGEEEAA